MPGSPGLVGETWGRHWDEPFPPCRWGATPLPAAYEVRAAAPAEPGLPHEQRGHGAAGAASFGVQGPADRSPQVPPHAGAERGPQQQQDEAAALRGGQHRALCCG